MRFLKYFYLLPVLFLWACPSKSQPDPLPPLDPFVFAKGADVGWLTEMEAAGIKFYNAAGQQQECMQLLKDLGMNTIRLRVWVNPANGWNAPADVITKAVRAKNLGMKVMIDFHYSDTWADPGQQAKPVAWMAQDFTTLQTSVYNHTFNTLTALKANGVTPTWVQVGNETNDGMLWPTGKASTNMANFAALVNKGYDAVKAVDTSMKVIVHISNGNDNGLFRWIFTGLESNSAKYDVIGMSLYPEANNWQTMNTDCLQNVNDMITRFNKPVMITEVGMAWDQHVACKAFITDLIQKMKAIPNSKGLGVLYWEPESYANWKGYTKGAFDNSGKATVALEGFK